MPMQEGSFFFRIVSVLFLNLQEIAALSYLSKMKIIYVEPYGSPFIFFILYPFK